MVHILQVRRVTVIDGAAARVEPAMHTRQRFPTALSNKHTTSVRSVPDQLQYGVFEVERLVNELETTNVHRCVHDRA